MSSPLVMIDDTDSSIQYSGPWFEAQVNHGYLVNTGTTNDFGPPFQNTSHGVNASANFSFHFSGSAVFVFGSIILTNASENEDPFLHWDCFVDNTSISRPSNPFLPPSPINQNNVMLCDGGVDPDGKALFQDGPHLLTVNTNVSNQQTFWFDRIQYAPSASVSLNQSFLRIDASDSAIQYSGWEPVISPVNERMYYPDNASTTHTTGATLTYQFSGTSISWVGTTTPGDNAASATYTVDDQGPNTFLLPLPEPYGLFNQMLFETAQLSPGQHKLVVTYYGNSTTVPLSLSYFVQQDSPSSTSSNNTPTSTSVPPGNSSPKSLPIIGGVIGGLVFISLLLVLFFFTRRRNNRRSQARALNEVLYIDIADPFTVPSSNPTSIPPKNYTPNVQSLSSPSISSKFSQSAQPSDPRSTSSSGGIPPLTPLALPAGQPRFSSLASIPPSSSPLLLTGSRTSLDGIRTTVPQAATEPMIQQSPSPQGANVRFVRHEDSGVRVSLANVEDDVVELPPLYTPG